jgi:hypothetical protein
MTELGKKKTKTYKRKQQNITTNTHLEILHGILHGIRQFNRFEKLKGQAGSTKNYVCANAHYPVWDSNP